MTPEIGATIDYNIHQDYSLGYGESKGELHFLIRSLAELGWVDSRASLAAENAVPSSAEKLKVLLAPPLWC